MKLRVAGTIVVLAAASWMIFWLTRSDQSEVLLSSGVGLTPEWQTITPPRILNTTEPWSEVLIEMPTLDFRGVGKRVLLADGTSLNVDAYLVTEDAKQINLEMAPMAFDTKVVLGYGPPCSTGRRATIVSEH
jgi:hypothetical protein